MITISGSTVSRLFIYDLSLRIALIVSQTSQTVWKRSGEWHLTASDPESGRYFRVPA